ncbi:MAG: glucose-6-phosphate dehydrogenase [Nitrospirae bacterium]|nr:MAG: glucose-6-phosphate dehydrogenase [Nitrospirota bacterium]
MPTPPTQPVSTCDDSLWSALTQPCSLVIFGASGDLTKRKLLPALYNLLLDGLLPPCLVLGLGRKPWSDEDFRQVAREGIEQFSRQPLQPERWEDFQRRLFYMSGKLDDRQTFVQLKKRLEDLETRHHLPGNRIYYLAIPPTAFAAACQGLDYAGLVYPVDDRSPYSRVIVEKPIGRDLQSARELNAIFARVFDESQIYRIDHYLGKETVQNIMVLRFANAIFEPLWNYKYIDHVQITVSEAETVGKRAAYYEETGALRDMVQNHLLQLLCLIATEPPYSLDPDVVRNARMDVLRGLRPIRGKETETMTVRANIAHGVVNGVPVPGYRREEGVRPDSTTETYVALKVFVDNWRWAGVPFYIRTGKALPKRASEIAIQFKEVPQILFNANPHCPLDPNLLLLRIQPEEGMAMRIISKVPGTKAQTHPVEMNFKYGDAFTAPSPEAYERLLLDVMAGDASLFMRRDAVEASWAWITEILEGWARYGTRWLPEYPAGTWGPVEADRLIEMDGRKWRVL